MLVRAPLLVADLLRALSRRSKPPARTATSAPGAQREERARARWRSPGGRREATRAAEGCAEMRPLRVTIKPTDTHRVWDSSFVCNRQPQDRLSSIGAFLKVQGGPLPTQNGTSTGNRPFNDLWLALAPVFGVSLSSLGDKTQYTGPLPGAFRT